MLAAARSRWPDARICHSTQAVPTPCIRRTQRSDRPLTRALTVTTVTVTVTATVTVTVTGTGESRLRGGAGAVTVTVT
eukprot:9253274-Pyramimonas_sp.AAC.1